MTFDSRWKDPQGKTPEHLYDAIVQLVRELRKGDYLPGTPDAGDIAYDNATSGLTADTVQEAIDENDGRLDALESPPAGLVLIATQEASTSATIDFVHGTGGVVLDNTYDEYELRFSGVVVETDNVSLYLRVATAGPTWQADAADYGYAYTPRDGGADVADDTEAFIPLAVSVGNAAGENANGSVEFANPEVAELHSFRFHTSFQDTGGTIEGLTGHGQYSTAEAIIGIRILASADDILSGRFSLYGYRKA